MHNFKYKLGQSISQEVGYNKTNILRGKIVKLKRSDKTHKNFYTVEWEHTKGRAFLHKKQ
jgi:hypothetical protein